MGMLLSIINSTFQNNFPLYDYEDLNSPLLTSPDAPLYASHTENAGALLVLSQNLMIKNCYLANNSNMNGGAIFFNKHFSDSQTILIENTVFYRNGAGETGSAIYFGTDIKFIIGEIRNCSFLEGFSFYGIAYDKFSLINT